MLNGVLHSSSVDISWVGPFTTDTITPPTTSTTNIACKNQTAILFLCINIYNTRKLVLNSFILWKCGKLIRPYTFLWANKSQCQVWVLCCVGCRTLVLSSCSRCFPAVARLEKQHELGLYPRLLLPVMLL